MMSSGPRPTKLELWRFQRIYELGCICCRLNGVFRECQINHLLEGGMGSARRGHRFTTGECPWHHVGEPPEGMTTAQACEWLGPSRKLSPAAFHRQFGTDEQLLEQTDRAIDWREPERPRRRSSLTSSKVIQHAGVL